MSAVITSVGAGPQGWTPGRPEWSQRARFAAQRLCSSTVLVTAEGDIDASNGPDLADYAERCSADFPQLVVDLSRVEFFGTQGFSSLHDLNVRCARGGVDWVAVPSWEVMRLLRVCDPRGALPLAVTVGAAMATLEHGPRRQLKLILDPV